MKIFNLFLSLTMAYSINLSAEDANRTNVTKLYIATFNRAPDSAGVNYWVDGKMPLEDIAMSFFDQQETQEMYPKGYSTIDFINSIYDNLFQRTPDQNGSDYWKSELDINNMQKSVFILAVVNGAKGDDETLLSNKTDVGLAFIKSGSNDVTKAKDIMKDVTANKFTVTNALKEIEKFKGVTNETTEDKTDTKTETKSEEVAIITKPKEDISKKETTPITLTKESKEDKKVDSTKEEETSGNKEESTSNSNEDDNVTLPETETETKSEPKERDTEEKEESKDDLPTF